MKPHFKLEQLVEVKRNKYIIKAVDDNLILDSFVKPESVEQIWIRTGQGRTPFADTLCYAVHKEKSNESGYSTVYQVISSDYEKNTSVLKKMRSGTFQKRFGRIEDYV